MSASAQGFIHVNTRQRCIIQSYFSHHTINSKHICSQHSAWNFQTHPWHAPGIIVLIGIALESSQDAVVAHASAKLYAAQAATTAGWTASRPGQSKRTSFKKDVPDHAAFGFLRFAVEICG